MSSSRPEQTAAPKPPPGMRIKVARVSAGMTQPELAERLGISRPTLHRIEVGNGGREVSIDELLRVGELCDVPEAFMRHGWAALDFESKVLDAIEKLRDDLRKTPPPRRASKGRNDKRSTGQR